MHRLLALVIDTAPSWIWRPANLRFIGRHAIHFCFSGGRRIVEINARTVAIGRRIWHISDAE